ncbi:lysylphosphatidylglycerol synthase transmembrane domain-containing protein [Niabella terrae]
MSGSPSQTARFTKPIQFLFFLALVILFIYWSVKDLSPVDRQQIHTALLQADYRMLLLGSISLLLGHILRALRWGLLIETLGYRPSKVNIFFAVMVGYFANQAMPRIGEILKCSTLTRYERIPFDKLLGTVILERMIDGAVLLLLLATTLGMQPGLRHQISALMHLNPANYPETARGYLMAGLLLLGALIIGLVWLFSRKPERRWFLRLRQISRSIWMGFSTIRHLRKQGRFLLYTLLIWLMYGCCVYSGFRMFSETAGFHIIEVMTILCAGSIGMILTPGGIGAYAFLVQKTVMLYQVSAAWGLVLGWLLWLLQTALIILMGSISLISLPFYNRRKSSGSRPIHEK